MWDTRFLRSLSIHLGLHKKGALSAARQGDNVNPKKESSGCQFYIVTGKVYNDSTLLGMNIR